MGKPKDAILNFYDIGDDKTTSSTTEMSQSEACPAMWNHVESNESTPKRLKLQQPSVMKYGMSTDSKMKAQLDEQIARAFYACNIPFNVISHPKMQKAFTMLRPGYQPPNRKHLAGYLLDNVHDSITMNMKSELKGKGVTLMQDGWSDIHNTPVIASTIQCGDKSYFMSAVETGTNKKTAAYCTSIAQDAINEPVMHMSNTTSVVTDNEKKMQVVRNNLKETDPTLTVYGCAAHWLNLLGQDVTPSQLINQTKLRNRLGLFKAAKLVTCYRFLRGKDEIDW